MERRRLIAGAAGALLFSLAPCQIAWGAKLVNVRMWPAAEYTRVTIETDEPLKYKHFFVRSAKPLRLVIDIEGLALTERIKKLIAAVNPDDPYIQSMRIGQYKPGVVRLAMDLKTDVKPEVFLLKPFADYQYRLVFDIYPAHPKDEVGKILAGEADPNEDPLLSAMGGLSSDANEPDPLADILAGLNTPRESAKLPVKPAERRLHQKSLSAQQLRNHQTQNRHRLLQRRLGPPKVPTSLPSLSTPVTAGRIPVQSVDAALVKRMSYSPLHAAS